MIKVRQISCTLSCFYIFIIVCFYLLNSGSHANDQPPHTPDARQHHETHGANNGGHIHHPADEDGGFQVYRAAYSIPDVQLTDMNNKQINFKQLVDDDPLILNFIFTTCTAICPTLTATFSQLQEKLSSSNLSVPLISISIDPEHDTPARLQTYAKKYGAGPDWKFLTGKKANIVSLQRSFDAYRGNKMNHIPLTFVKLKSREWIRIDGFISASGIIEEYRKCINE